MKIIGQIVIVLLLTAVAIAQTTNQCHDEVKVFVSGNDGYASYRIPAMVSTMQKTVLAF